MKRFSNHWLMLAGAILLWAAWPVSPFTLLIFVAWTPLLWIEGHTNSWKRFLGLTYLHMLCWNLLVTWWVWNASLPGALGAFFANSLVMSIPWLLFHFTRKKWGDWIGYSSLIIYWISFEYLHHNWDLSWPWLTLGNVFAMHPEWVQWYQFTGTTGGTLWVLISNIIVYRIFIRYRRTGRSRNYYFNMAGWIAVLLFPMLFSRWILNQEKNAIRMARAAARDNVVVVQPNVDPYTEKFSGSIESQVHKLITLSERLIDTNTTLVVWPETAVPAQVWEDEIKENFFYYPIWSFLKRHPRVSLLTGIDSYRNYGTDKNNATKTARREPNSGIWYDAYNTAAFFDADTTIQLYHKAKLVPGVETLPSFLNFMSGWFEDFGGISGTLGRDSDRKVFAAKEGPFKAAPVICYESIYSDYITEYIRKGGNLLTIITNDGWWGDTPGYKQHMNYARIRAIETRKWIARSANTGISCFIDPTGNVIDPQPWNSATSIKLAIPSDDRQTFFVRHGDVLSRACTAVALLLIALNIISWTIKRFRRR